jgi:hypothetical protein
MSALLLDNEFLDAPHGLSIFSLPVINASQLLLRARYLLEEFEHHDDYLLFRTWSDV